MGLLNDYGVYGGYSGRTSPRSRYFSGPTTGGFNPPRATTPQSADQSGPVQRTVPERIIVDDLVNDATGMPEDYPAALEFVGKAPGYILGAPVSAVQTAGKAGGLDILGFLGDVAQAIPFLPGLNRETEEWNWSLGGFLGQAMNGAGDAVTAPIKLVHTGINAANAEAIRKALSADPNAEVEYTLPNLSSIMRKLGSTFGMEDPGKQETNAEFLARMTRLGWTQDDMAAIASGRDAWSFGELDKRISEDVWTDLALNLMLDPLTYTPAVAMRAPGIGRGIATAISRSEQAVTQNVVAEMLSGSQAALRARAGAGLASNFVRRGVLPAAYMPVKMASQAIRSGAAGAAQHATRWSVADAILTSTRGFRQGFVTPFKPIGAMVRHAADVPGYVRGFGPIPEAEMARAAEFGLRTPSRFWRGMSGYASRSTALRGTEHLFNQTAEGLDALLGDEDGDNTAIGGFTENLRELGHAMVNEDPINSNLTGMIVAGFMYPGIPIIGEALGVARRSGAAGRAANSIKGVWDDVTWRTIGPNDIPNEEAFLNLFSKRDFRANRNERYAARREVVEMLGGMPGVRRLWDAATTALVREHLIKNLPSEWRIRGVASTSARAAMAAPIFRRAREDMIRAGMLTDRDIMHAIMAMDEGTGGFDLAKAAERANGASATSGGQMRWNGDLAARTWVRFMAASEPVNNALLEKGHQVVAGIREYLPRETVSDMRAALMIVKQGKGKDAYVTALDVQRMLRDHPQLIALDGTGYWKQFAIMDPSERVKWNSVGRKLANVEKNAPTWDEVMADVNAQEATGAPVTGMSGEPLRAGSVALDDGRIRYAHAPPGEARVAVSRMNPEIGDAPNTYRGARALRTNPAIAAYEGNVGAVLHDAGVNVDQVHQTVGGWASDGKVFREPSVSITMGRTATLEETRLTAAMTARSANQAETLFWVTGSRLGDLGVTPNAALGRITNIPRRGYAKVEEVLHRRYGDGYTFDDTAGEAIMFVPDARIDDLLPDLEASLAEAGVKGTVGAEPAYVEFLGGPDIDNILKGAADTDDVRLTRFNEGIQRVLDDPDYAAANRIAGNANRTLLASTRTGRSRGDGVRHGTLTTEGLIRDGIRRTQAPDGSVIPGLEADNAALRQQLRDLMTVKREALTRHQVLYKAADPGDFDPTAPITLRATDEILPDGWNEGSAPIGTARYAPESRPPVGAPKGTAFGTEIEVLREVPVDSLMVAQDVLSIEQQASLLKAIDEGVDVGYGRAVLFGGRLVLLDGHHRLNLARQRGEGSIKVWVGEAIDQPTAAPGGRSNDTVTLPIDEDTMYGTPLDDDEFIMQAFSAKFMTAEQVRARMADAIGPRPKADMEAYAALGEDEAAQPARSEFWSKQRAAEQEWEYQVRRAMARGDIDSQQAEALGLRDSTVERLPDEPLYHATTSMSGVMREGLKTRNELGGRTALGGGADDTISFTTDRAIADRIAETFIEARAVLRGEITLKDLLKRAEDGGFGPAFRRYATTYFENQDAADPAFANLLEGRKRVSNVLGGELPEGAIPIGEGVKMSNGKTAYGAYWAPAEITPDDLMTAYKGFLAAQEAAGKGYNPLFFSPDLDALASLDPADVGVVTARANPGAQGTQMVGMAEWRTWSGDAVTIEGRIANPEVQVKQRFAQAEEQVLFNRTLDAELDEVFPMLKYDRSTGSLSPDELAELTPAYHYLMKNFGGAYDLKVAPEMAFPIDEVLPASLKVSSLVGEWVRQYGPVSKINAMVDWFLAPVDTGRQAGLARQAMYRQLVPRGATVKQVDQWVNEMSKMTSQFAIGPLRLKIFRDATALTPDWINKAAAEAFPESVIKQVGGDNFHLILDRSANRFIRDTMFPGLQGGRQNGGSRGRLQRLLAEGYYIFQTGDPTGKIRPRGQRTQITGLRRIAEGKRLLAKTIYPVFRFMLDPRWHLMNRFEYNALSALKDGIATPEHRTGQFRKGRNVAAGDPISDYGAVTTMADIEQLPPGAQRSANLNVEDALLDIESVGGGFLHNREAAGFIARIWQSRAIDDIADVVNRMPEMDAGLRDLMRLFPDDDARPIYDKINEFMYEMDMRGAKDTVTAQAVKEFGAEVAAELEPMLNQIALRHQQTFDAITQMLQGNPARNNLERIMNSYWLYWPISYQLKAGKWLTQVLTEGFGGRKTNFGGASWLAAMTEKHIEKLATDPEYQQFMEDHEGLFLAATMMLPITPFDLGVSLNRGIRGVGGHLGLWEEYKRAQDPVVFATWLAELGPLYSIQLAQQVWGETFGERASRTENERSGRSVGTSVPTFDTAGSGGAPVPTFGP